jgi:hypothetical protein
MSIGILCPRDGECLEDVADKQGFANVFPKATVVDGPSMPEYPTTSQAKASI